MKNFTNTDLIGFLEDYCRKNKIYFIPGPDDYQNAVMDEDTYKAYDLIMCFDCTLSPDFSGDASSMVYSGTIALGRKREDTTVSTLDETFKQKYSRRLLALTDTLIGIFNELQCDEDTDILRCTMSYALNRFDLNADFVVADISIRIY